MTMDPRPKDTVSECWAARSASVFIDTHSEPPAQYGNAANKIMRRSSDLKNNIEPLTPMSKLSRRLEGDKNKTTSSNTSIRSRRSAKSKAGSKSQMSTSSGRSRKSKSGTSSTKSSSSNCTRRSRSSQGGRSKKSGSTVKSSSSSIRSKSSSRVETESVATGRVSRDPDELSVPMINNNFAIVPVARREFAGIDPPDSDSMSGSSSRRECMATLYNPPSREDYSTASSRSQVSRADYSAVSRPSSRADYSAVSSQSQSYEQLTTWDEDDDDDSESYDDEESRLDTIESKSNVSEDSDYSKGEQGGELASAIECALAIREKDDSDEYTYGDEDAKDSRALALCSYSSAGVESHYEGNEGVIVSADHRNDGAIVSADHGNDGAIVQADQNRYLAAAVDNYGAMVPTDSAMYEAYDHTFVTCPEHLRFRFLYTFLKKNLDKKIMVFFSTTNSAQFHAKLLSHFHIPSFTMHSRQKRDKFIRTFFKFSDSDEGILCATDSAGRDLDIPPSVDWVIQFEPPDDPSEFILRVARISCDSDRVGRSLLFLNPGEQGFLKYYHSASIPLSEFEIPKTLADIHPNIEYHVNKSEKMLRYARDAYGSYLIAYASHGFRDVYNVHDLNKENVATGFGLVTMPDMGDDDQTEETETLASSHVGDESRVGGELAEYHTSSRSTPGQSNSNSKQTQGEKQEKSNKNNWMKKDKKSWPHSQIKLHPRFKDHKDFQGLT